jgi:DNA-binding NtrC family response regulator
MVMATATLLAGLDVLLVEDETLVSFMIEDMLDELGAASVRHAARVDAGLELLSHRKPSLAVLDVNIAGELVYPIAERLEEARVPFIFITGYGRQGLVQHWRRHEVLQKPLTLAMLEDSLRNILVPERGT